jgi:amino acid transporter
MAEETHEARTRAPWGIFMSVAVSGVVGYILILALTIAIGNIGEVLKSTVPPPIAIVQSAVGIRAGTALGALASMAMWFCGLAATASASRTVYALARDHGTPRSEWLKRVHPKHGTPGPAIWTVAICSVAAMAWAEAIPIVTSLSTVTLYISYGIPILLGLIARRVNGDDWTAASVWRLGGAGKWINLAAVLYTAFICIVLMMPPNELAAKGTLGLIAGLLLLWFVRARSRYSGPKWSAAVHTAAHDSR